MKCPKCKNKKMFLVAISATAKYDAEKDKLDEYDDVMIDNRELVTCCECNYVGHHNEFEFLEIGD